MNKIKKRSCFLKKELIKKTLPRLIYNKELPIIAKKDEIIESISKNRVLIISGETGSGKTTQIPKFCLEAGRGIDGIIGCTQPRRIAAVSVANRIAEELGQEVGNAVGYKIRFAKKTSKTPLIKIMTDGILLAETRSDITLSAYDTIIVDEAHERSLNIDFLLGLLKSLLDRRKNLKLIITSATIDTEKFSKAFDNAPVIEVSGRMYPVDIRYEPGPAILEDETKTNLKDNKKNDQDRFSHVDRAVEAVDMLLKKTPSGDILVFMPTQQDILETCNLVEEKKDGNFIVLPVFARLPGSQQAKIFTKISKRKIIVATNIAETSITIPGIKYVIDTGLARIPAYKPGSRITSLAVGTIAKSSADQRMGRCGRVENGVCIRLYSEDDYNMRPVFTPPEILRANLAEVILKMIDLKLGDIDKFPFIDSPTPKSIKDGFNLLTELGAIAKKQSLKKGFSLTKTGKLMAKMPIDPRLSRMLIEAESSGCIMEVAVIASALSIQDVREHPAEKKQQADMMHRVFLDPSSDFITLLNIWNRYHDTWKKVKTRNSMRRFCKEHYISYKRIKEWRDIHSQILSVLKEYNQKKYTAQPNDKKPGDKKAGDKKSGSLKQADSKKDLKFHPLYISIHKSILSGFLSNIACKKEKNIFRAARQKEVMLFPGSGLFNKSGKWIVVAELVETSRLFARIAANIEPSWIEEKGRHLCRYTYLHPVWKRNTGMVTAFEQVSIFGLILAEQRPVSYGRINPKEASEIFIRNALVENDVKKPLEFMLHNQKFVEQIMDVESRIRKRDILISHEEMFQFYQKRIPGVFDFNTLLKQIKKKGGDNFLRMDKEYLARYLPDRNEMQAFPDTVLLGKKNYKCKYEFNPGKYNDGLTIKIPAAFASTVPPTSTEWLVPGFLKEKIAAIIKGLPKKYRKQLVPVARSVDIIIRQMPMGETSIYTALAKFVLDYFKVDIPASVLASVLLPDHLNPRISLTDHKGREIDSGRGKEVLQRIDSTDNKALPEPRAVRAIKDKWERQDLKEWDFPDLPDSLNINEKNAAGWALYPALETGSKKTVINLKLFHQNKAAQNSHKKGVAALFENYFAKDLKFLKKSLVLPENTKKMAGHFGSVKAVEKMIYNRVIKILFSKNIRTKDAFYAYTESVDKDILKTGKEILNRIIPVIESFHETVSEINFFKNKNINNKTATLILDGLHEDLKMLVPENFIDLYETEKIIHLTRYIKACGIRVKRAVVDLKKDQQRALKIEIYKNSLKEQLNELISPEGKISDEKKDMIEEFFWMIEEYKVSVFAQELKTAFRVSGKKLDVKLKEIKKMV